MKNIYRRCVLLMFFLQIGSGYAQNSLARHDPTRPPDFLSPNASAKTTKPVQHYDLTSIITSKHRRLALLNGRFVKEGNLIGQAKVKRIEDNRVILLLPKDGREIYLDLIDKRQWKLSS